MSIAIRRVSGDDVEELIPLLLQAEPSESALRWSLKNLSDTVYRMDDAGELVGAATIRLKAEPCEILEIAIAPDRQGKGFGKQLVAWLISEARLTGKKEMLVGTSSTSVDNILFYQKCGFRIDHIRKDYFWYYHEPIYENGLQVRDMIVFRYDLAG